MTASTGLSISEVMLANELSWRSEADVRAGLLDIWRVMQECVERGCSRDGTLPGGLKVRRRAAELRRSLEADVATPHPGTPHQAAAHLATPQPAAADPANPHPATPHPAAVQPATGQPVADCPANPQAGAAARVVDPLHVMDWVTLFALAVNEENAAGGRVVTAPTNGAAGIIPAVLHYYTRFVPGASADGVVRFLLAAGAIGVLFKENASISGAEVGCQGEVGSACSMAAAGLAEALGGTPAQVENAAEIGMEHNLGLTCDPVGGLVQIPCIERNAVASIKAITAARLALRGDGVHAVSLDKVIKTMRETGADMKVKYKETARGGLAVNVIEC
ncbi:L-serine ammonia-lyase [Micromonospora fiedleri]|uniref:L-serine ammonia-lyase n=1 Tax=Micromonospora fiedleri TaxID=1157498 RepID=UPI003F684B25